MLVTLAATINRHRSTDWGIKRGWIGANLQRVALPDALKLKYSFGELKLKPSRGWARAQFDSK